MKRILITRRLLKSCEEKASKIFETNLKVGDELLNYKNEKLCIKIDVEGHELSVLKGLAKNLKENKCMILVESGDVKFVDVNDFLIKMHLI